ncbi:MAG TPA: HAD family phosphatase [Kiritimatiellia bacterium]|nr:HAD family phosphatase [Kiritimatiellia bacterium]
MIRALIFDFDGIIVNTEPLHHRAFQKIFAPLGLDVSWDEYLSDYIGFDDRDAVRERFRSAGRELDADTHSRLIADKAKAFLEVIEEAPAADFPGVVDLIRAASKRLPVALCSGAVMSDIRPFLRRLDLESCFQTVVTAEDVAASKPDPMSYRLALAKLQMKHPQLGLAPENTLAIEDTPAGIASARGAGLKVIAVTNSYPAISLGDAHAVVTSLEGQTLASLAALVDGKNEAK